MKSETYGIHWFRRDLRTRGNPALTRALERHHGRVVGLFAFDPKFLARPDLGLNRFGFFIETLGELRREMKELGGELLVLDRGPDQAFSSILASLKKAGLPLPESVSFNRDYEPYARERDARIEEMLFERFGVRACTERDHLLIEPHEIYRDDEPGRFYQVFTPFSKRWLKLFGSDEIQARLKEQAHALRARKTSDRFSLSWKSVFCSRKELIEAHPDRYDAAREKVLKKLDITLPKAGSEAALALLTKFESEALDDYLKERDFPAASGTSKMSVYLKNGSITTSQIICSLGLDQKASRKGSREKYLTELIWREFYYHILYHCPRVESSAFLQKYQNIAWENREDWFRAWCEGRTGYPIVDAAMRQLNTTGWMHNRMRMVVASFLTKDLLISWQWGERYFMQKLLDGDLAPNNGGWQWAASTGCDPQPYFRIFNPSLQSKRFDPDGEYIRKYVPELKSVEARYLHEPWKSPQLILGYPSPIVDHAVQSKKAIALFKAP